MLRASMLLVLFLSTVVCAQTTRPRFTVLPQPGSPVTLKVPFSGAPEISLISRSSTPLSAFRIGWFVRERATVGQWVSVSGSKLRVGAGLHFSLNIVAPGFERTRSEAAVFIAELRFSDGTVWRANMRQLQREAAKLQGRRRVQV